MSVLIIGSEGSMGKRYQAIMKFLGKDYACTDRYDSQEDYLQKVRSASGYIVCTPTMNHAYQLSILAQFGRPILCEKPVVTSVPQLNEIIFMMRENRTPFQMVYQYKRLVESGGIGWSYYNYFRHGSDGLVWDCLQIVGLSTGPIRLEEDSPIWKCMINGQHLSLSDMDRAYLEMIQDWYKDPQGDLGEILGVHQKVEEMSGAVKWQK